MQRRLRRPRGRGTGLLAVFLSLFRAFPRYSHAFSRAVWITKPWFSSPQHGPVPPSQSLLRCGRPGPGHPPSRPEPGSPPHTRPGPGHSPTRTLALTHPHAPSHVHTHTHPHTLMLTHPHTHAHMHTYLLTCIYSHTHSHSRTHAHSAPLPHPSRAPSCRSPRASALGPLPPHDSPAFLSLARTRAPSDKHTEHAYDCTHRPPGGSFCVGGLFIPKALAQRGTAGARPVPHWLRPGAPPALPGRRPRVRSGKCMCARTCACAALGVHVRACTCVSVCITWGYTHVRACGPVCVCVCAMWECRHGSVWHACVHVSACVHVLWARMSVCACTCSYICVCICGCVYAHCACVHAFRARVLICICLCVHAYREHMSRTRGHACV